MSKSNGVNLLEEHKRKFRVGTKGEPEALFSESESH